MKKLIPQKIKNIYHLSQAVLANFWFGFPSEKIKVIGVTGTNGKTTTVQMITRILEESGAKVAMASTINFKLGGKEWVNKTKFTTLSAFAVQKFVRDAVKDGCEYLILETSSHSLDQYRVWGVEYDTAVITNVTREHLDYHKTMEEYRQAKKRLFGGARVAIINLDMENPKEFLAGDFEKTYGYTTKSQETGIESQGNMFVLKADNMRLEINFSEYRLQEVDYRINLPGKFNIENALAATCVGFTYGVSGDIISRALGKIKGISGRMEGVPNGKELSIIIDYAVTPDSLEKLYELVEKIKGSSPAKIISVFGSCGERDRGKRPIMGKIVSQSADFIILTNEDPYHEDPMRIIDEVASGIKNKKEGDEFWKILDRRKAIRTALRIANPGDFVIVTGKGAEETMAVGKERIPWNDRKVIKEELEKI